MVGHGIGRAITDILPSRLSILVRIIRALAGSPSLSFSYEPSLTKCVFKGKEVDVNESKE